MKEKDGNIGFGNDEALMWAVSQGRRDALNALMDRYMPMVSRTSYRILCDQAESDDVTQEVFVKVWSNAYGFDGRYSLSTWIYRITTNLCYDKLRRRRVLDFLSISPSLYEMSAPQALSPEEDYITKETWEIFCRASRGLSPKQRTVFTLRDLEELSTEEVAAITGLTPDQIKSNLHIARKKVRSELEKYGKVR